MKVTAGASYIAVTAIFNSTEIQPVRKICSSNLNQTENLFDVLNALFDGSCLVNEIDFYIYMRKKVNDKSNVSSILLVIRLCIYFVQLLDIATG